jgi:hypothetical protein
MKRTARNHGLASVMGMIYLCVMSALAVGFFTAVDMATDVSDNEQNINQSLMAADEGMTYTRYQFAQLSLPAGSVQASNLMGTVYSSFNSAYTSKLGGTSPTTQGSGAATVMYFPGQSGTANTWATADGQGGQFWVNVSQSGMNLSVTAVGQNTNAKITPITRKMQLTYILQPSKVLNYGVVTGGPIQVNGTLTVNSALSNNNDNILSLGSPPIVATASHTATIGGSISYPSTSTPTWTGVKVDGTYSSTNHNFSSYVYALTSPPPMPVIDTSAFTQYASNSLTGTSYLLATKNNIVVPANTSVTFTDCTINGIVYLENGASATFYGGTINGAIVQDPAATSGSITFNDDLGLIPVTINQINCLSNQALAALSVLPSAELNLQGSAVLAPSATVTFNSPNMTIQGTVVGDSLVVNKNLTIQGSLIGISSGKGSNPIPLSVNNSTTLTIDNPLPVSTVIGVDANTFTPKVTTYEEN